MDKLKGPDSNLPRKDSGQGNLTARAESEGEFVDLARFPVENPNPVLRIDRGGVLLYGNSSSIPVQKAWDTAPGERLPEGLAGLVARLYEEGEKQEVGLVHDGRTYALQFVPVAGRGYVNVYGADVTERRKAEKEIVMLLEQQKRLIAELNVTNDKWQNANEELQAANEELRVANEELLTMTEELHIANDELKEQSKVLKELNRELELGERKYRQLVETTMEGIWVADTSGQTLYVNRRMAEMLGYTVEELMAGNRDDFFDPGSREYAMKIRAERVRGISGQYELKMRRKDGSVVWALISGSPVYDEAGRHIANLGMHKDITDRKLAEEAIQESDARFRMVLENSLDVAYRRNLKTDRYDYISPVIERITGFTPEEMNAMSKAEAAERIHPDDRRAVSRETSKTLRGLRGNIEYRFRGKNGEYHWLSDSFSVIDDTEGTPLYRVGIIRDITERIRQEQECDFQATVLAQVNDAVIALDNRAYVTYWNRAAEDRYGLKAADVIGKPLRDVLGYRWLKPEDQKAAAKSLRSRGNWIGDNILVLKNGEEKIIRSSVTVMRDQNGERMGIVAVIRDITESRKLEQIKDDLLGMVSHELRTPLTVVIGCLNTIITEKERLSPPEIDQLLRDAASESEELNHLLGNFLELSRAQAGRLTLYKEPVRIEQVLARVFERIRQQGYKQRLETEVPEALTPVSADPIRLERIIYNLVENAAKYSPGESDITVFTRPDRGVLVFGVRDRGAGIPEEERDRLFEPFERLEQNQLKSKGIGLGLLTCRRLIEAHGGRIWVESEVGKGSTFFFSLPR